jgi:DNA polymerase V
MMPTIYTAASGAQVVPHPLLASRVEAGFPSPADDHVDRALDLNEEFIARPAATFFLRAGGCSMEGAGIYDGDLLIVDRSISPEINMVIVAVVDGEFTVKRLCKSSEGFVLAAEHPSYPPIVIGQDIEVCAWGVVTWVIHRP